MALFQYQCPECKGTNVACLENGKWGNPRLLLLRCRDCLYRWQSQGIPDHFDYTSADSRPTEATRE